MIEEKTIETPSLPNISDSARVWIYQIDREFSEAETQELKQMAQHFVDQWKAHNNKLTASYGFYFNRFLCLFVDESAHGASGCSIDSSVRFIQDLERHFDASFMNRTTVAYISEGGSVETTDMHALGSLKADGKINENTRVFNNLVKTAGEMKTGWIVPIKDSWHARMV